MSLLSIYLDKIISGISGSTCQSELVTVSVNFLMVGCVQMQGWIHRGRGGGVLGGGNFYKTV